MDNPAHPDPKQELPAPPEEKLLRAPTFWEKYGKLVTGLILMMLICIAGFSAWVIYVASLPTGPETTMMPPAAKPSQPQSSPTTSPLVPTTFNGIASEKDASQSADLSPSAPACSQEVQVCPNGSYVGRTGPNCEFTACL